MITVKRGCVMEESASPHMPVNARYKMQSVWNAREEFGIMVCTGYCKWKSN